MENKIDIVAFAEAENLDIISLVNTLHLHEYQWKAVEVCPGSDIRLLAKKEVHISAHKEEKRFSSYKLYLDKTMYLLHVVHLHSPTNLEESARYDKVLNVRRVLGKIEDDLYRNEEYKSIIVGDFNLQPYSRGVSGIYGFNATMSASKAMKKSRIVDGEMKYFYFNPIWKLMGDNRIVQGTYYSNNDQQGKSIFWYSFDQLLIRPYFIEKFNWDYFDIVERTASYQFVRNEVIDKYHYSDHLPLKFEVL